MPELFLNKVGKEYVDRGYKIRVQREPYRGFRIFEKIRFADVDGIPFHYFSIIKQDKKGRVVYMYDYDSRKDFNLDNIEYVDVYFSKSNNSNILILKVCNAGTHKFYKYTAFKMNREMGIRNLSEDFELKGKLSEHLIDENDLVNGLITYRVDKMDSYNNIKVEEKENQPEGFITYTHTPKEDKFKKHKSCVIYRTFLFEVDPKYKTKENELYYVQDVIFESVKVYFSHGGLNNDVPLLVHFIYSNIYNKRDQKNYFFTKNRGEKYWKPISLDYKGEDDINNLKTLLDELYLTSNITVNVLMSNKTDYYYTKYECISGNIEQMKDSIEKFKSSNCKRKTSKVQVFKSTSENYTCYDHNFVPYFGKLDGINSNFSAFRLFISNKEIKISNLKDKTYLSHNLDNHNVYVYFYNDDHFPLMIKHDKDFYGPKSKDKYFVEWEKIEKLKGQNTTELSDKYTLNHTSEQKLTKDLFNEEWTKELFKPEVIEQLDNINAMLNEIDIHKTSDYGIDEFEFTHECYNDYQECKTRECEIYCELRYRDMIKKQFDFTRIKVESEEIDIYKKYTHTTKNEFRIGNIIYNHKDLLKNYPKTDIITHGNSVSVYFFKYDIDDFKKIPLLLEYNHNKKIEYIIPKSKDGEKTERYKIENDNGDQKIKHKEIIALLDHQNSVLNKVISLSLDKRSDYPFYDSNIRKEEIDKIIVNEIKISEDPLLTKLGYKMFRHHNGDSDKRTENLLVSITKLFDPEFYTTPVIIKNFKIGNNVIHLKNNKNNIIDNLHEIKAAYVHFYREDPRPLLVYSGTMAFAPKSLESYYKEWFSVDSIGHPIADNVKYDLDLICNKLDEIVHFMYPVDISKSCTYSLDEHGGKDIKVNVKSVDSFIFRKHTHTPTSNNKLGLVKFRENRVLPDIDKHSYNSYTLESVTAYYYRSDQYYEYPILVELNIKDQEHNLYYHLTSTTPYKWEEVSYSKIKFIDNKVSVSSVLEISVLKSNEFIPEYIRNRYRIHDLNCTEDPNKNVVYDFRNESYTSSNYEEHHYNRGSNSGSRRINSFHETDGSTTHQSYYYGSNLNYEDDTYGQDPLQITGYTTTLEDVYDTAPYPPEIRSSYVEIENYDSRREHVNADRTKTLDLVHPSSGENVTEVSQSTNSKLPGVIGGVFGSLGVIGGGGFALYKFVGPSIIDMRPFF